jgi:hypothetical protein
MKKTILLATFLISSTLAFCQKSLSPDYTYNVSDHYKEFNKSIKYYFSKGNESVSLKIRKKDVFIQKFNNDKPAFIKSTLQKDFFPKDHKIESVLEFGENIYVFYSLWNDKDNIEQLFSVMLDFEKGVLSTTHKPIVIIDGKILHGTNFHFFDGRLRGVINTANNKFDFMLSHDKSKMLVQYVKKPEFKNDKKSYNVAGLVAFDENLNKISDREIKMPYTERRMDNLDYQLDNEGNIYLLVKVYHDDSNDDKKRNKDEFTNYHLELFYIKNGSSDIEISKFDNKDKFVNRLLLFDSSNDFLVCGGYYRNGDYVLGSGSEGVLTFKIDRKGKIYDETFHDIPVELINQYESKRIKKRNNKMEEKGGEVGVSNLDIKDIIINEDGSLIIIGEQEYEFTTRISGTNNFTHDITTSCYGSIFIAKLGIDKELKWMRKIPKAQEGVRGIGGMSFKYCNFNNYHYLIFLDNEKNIDLPIDESPYLYGDGKRGSLTVVKVSDNDGNLSKTSILNAKEIKDCEMNYFAVRKIIKASQNSFMFEVNKKKKEDVMIKVTLN